MKTMDFDDFDEKPSDLANKPDDNNRGQKRYSATNTANAPTAGSSGKRSKPSVMEERKPEDIGFDAVEYKPELIGNGDFDEATSQNGNYVERRGKAEEGNTLTRARAQQPNATHHRMNHFHRPAAGTGSSEKSPLEPKAEISPPNSSAGTSRPARGEPLWASMEERKPEDTGFSTMGDEDERESSPEDFVRRVRVEPAKDKVPLVIRMKQEFAMIPPAKPYYETGGPVPLVIRMKQEIAMASTQPYTSNSYMETIRPRHDVSRPVPPPYTGTRIPIRPYWVNLAAIDIAFGQTSSSKEKTHEEVDPATETAVVENTTEKGNLPDDPRRTPPMFYKNKRLLRLADKSQPWTPGKGRRTRKRTVAKMMAAREAAAKGRAKEDVREEVEENVLEDVKAEMEENVMEDVKEGVKQEPTFSTVEPPVADRVHQPYQPYEFLTEEVEEVRRVRRGRPTKDSKQVSQKVKSYAGISLEEWKSFQETAGPCPAARQIFQQPIPPTPRDEMPHRRARRSYLGSSVVSLEKAKQARQKEERLHEQEKMRDKAVYDAKKKKLGEKFQKIIKEEDFDGILNGFNVKKEEEDSDADETPKQGPSQPAVTSSEKLQPKVEDIDDALTGLAE